MAIIKSGASTDQLTIDATSKAARVTLYDAAGRETSMQSKATYSCTTANFTPAATATDIFKITGSATKTIRVIALSIGGTATAASVVDFFIIRRSADNTAGTFVAGTATKHDSIDSSATVTVGHYTANPSGLGSSAGTLRHIKQLLPITTTASISNENLVPSPDASLLDKPIVLRGTSELLVVNYNGAAVPSGGANWYVNCTWIEE